MARPLKGIYCLSILIWCATCYVAASAVEPTANNPDHNSDGEINHHDLIFLHTDQYSNESVNRFDDLLGIQSAWFSPEATPTPTETDFSATPTRTPFPSSSACDWEAMTFIGELGPALGPPVRDLAGMVQIHEVLDCKGERISIVAEALESNFEISLADFVGKPVFVKAIVYTRPFIAIYSNPPIVYRIEEYQDLCTDPVPCAMGMGGNGDKGVNVYHGFLGHRIDPGDGCAYHQLIDCDGEILPTCFYEGSPEVLVPHVGFYVNIYTDDIRMEDCGPTTSEVTPIRHLIFFCGPEFGFCRKPGPTIIGHIGPESPALEASCGIQVTPCEGGPPILVSANQDNVEFFNLPVGHGVSIDTTMQFTDCHGGDLLPDYIPFVTDYHTLEAPCGGDPTPTPFPGPVSPFSRLKTYFGFVDPDPIATNECGDHHEFNRCAYGEAIEIVVQDEILPPRPPPIQSRTAIATTYSTSHCGPLTEDRLSANLVSLEYRSIPCGYIVCWGPGCPRLIDCSPLEQPTGTYEGWLGARAEVYEGCSWYNIRDCDGEIVACAGLDSFQQLSDSLAPYEGEYVSVRLERELTCGDLRDAPNIGAVIKEIEIIDNPCEITGPTYEGWLGERHGVADGCSYYPITNCNPEFEAGVSEETFGELEPFVDHYVRVETKITSCGDGFGGQPLYDFRVATWVEIISPCDDSGRDPDRE